jgi:hypothetical protein
MDMDDANMSLGWADEGSENHGSTIFGSITE